MIKSEAKTDVIVVWRCPNCGRKSTPTPNYMTTFKCPFCDKAWMTWHIKYKGKEL